ncbi:hypothetical protein M406DRAFT_71209 [Cryphonectria parasitica EP155]|uniref:Uncharacterized protein n=1 Tax=Cryphonectria parasitica (strain ATCC 38755 / EP155) TaxID=660469 RepID=A0A9P5CNE5_CRYP1|nr:uncharacterized protein M406DRAFT_71209 [Cryphonectria parasitica EP155]KAF3764237.1 hypothetical protein M406DRAFT_71209 [Cryphonectria parasitica EP155]
MASLITSTIPSSTAAALSTTTTSLPDGTITTPIATLTTPFTPPAVSNCHPLWETTSVLTGLWDQDDHWTITTAQALISGPAADAQFQACQPSGWADVVSQSRYVFSPAVCPSGWTAYELTTFVSSAAFSTRRPLTASSAYCCAEGFSLDGGGQGIVTLHTAWNIIWEASDTSTLSPEPPKLTSGMATSTRVRGAVLLRVLLLAVEEGVQQQ